MSDWPELTTRFDLDVSFDDVRPTDAELDAFEAKFGLKLPEDYRRFVQALGAGEISDVDMCAIRSPSDRPGDHYKANLTYFNNIIRDGFDHGMRPSTDRDLDWLRALVYFCDLGEGACFCAWQPQEVTDPATGDMAIYVFNAEARANNLTRVASTFREFVMDFLLSNRYFREFMPGKQPGDYPDPNRVIGYGQYPYGIPGVD